MFSFVKESLNIFSNFSARSEKTSSDKAQFINLNVLTSTTNLFRSLSLASFVSSLNTFFGWIVTLIV